MVMVLSSLTSSSISVSLLLAAGTLASNIEGVALRVPPHQVVAESTNLAGTEISGNVNADHAKKHGGYNVAHPHRRGSSRGTRKRHRRAAEQAYTETTGTAQGYTAPTQKAGAQSTWAANYPTSRTETVWTPNTQTAFKQNTWTSQGQAAGTKNTWTGYANTNTVNQATTWIGYANTKTANQATTWAGYANTKATDQATTWTGYANTNTANQANTWTGYANTNTANQANTWTGYANTNTAGKGTAWTGTAQTTGTKTAWTANQAATTTNNAWNPATTATTASSETISSSAQLSSGTMMQKGGVKLGMLPDFGYSGDSDSFESLNNMVTSTGKKWAILGEYAQVQKDQIFDGSQLMARWDDLMSSGAIFEPAVMPTGGWSGFTWDNKTQAVAVCNVMQKFVDAGVPEVRLRFAHEANYYQSDGTYPGTAANFIEGFNVVASVCKEISPKTKMFWTPNIANLAQYTAYQPDMSNVDYIGIDYYPKQGTDLSTAFVQEMKPFHDKYTNEGTLFAIGETGLGWEGTYSDRLQWFNSIINAKSSMPYLDSAAWFNYYKDYNYKLVDKSDPSGTESLISYLTG